MQGYTPVLLSGSVLSASWRRRGWDSCFTRAIISVNQAFVSLEIVSSSLSAVRSSGSPEVAQKGKGFKWKEKVGNNRKPIGHVAIVRLTKQLVDLRRETLYSLFKISDVAQFKNFLVFSCLCNNQ